MKTRSATEIGRQAATEGVVLWIMWERFGWNGLATYVGIAMLMSGITMMIQSLKGGS